MVVMHQTWSMSPEAQCAAASGWKKKTRDANQHAAGMRERLPTDYDFSTSCRWPRSRCLLVVGVATVGPRGPESGFAASATGAGATDWIMGRTTGLAGAGFAPVSIKAASTPAMIVRERSLKERSS